MTDRGALSVAVAMAGRGPASCQPRQVLRARCAPPGVHTAIPMGLLQHRHQTGTGGSAPTPATRRPAAPPPGLPPPSARSGNDQRSVRSLIANGAKRPICVAPEPASRRPPGGRGVGVEHCRGPTCSRRFGALIKPAEQRQMPPGGWSALSAPRYSNAMPRSVHLGRLPPFPPPFTTGDQPPSHSTTRRTASSV